MLDHLPENKQQGYSIELSNCSQAARRSRIHKKSSKELHYLYKLKTQNKDNQIKNLMSKIQLLEMELSVSKQHNKFMVLQATALSNQQLLSNYSIEPFALEIQNLRTKNKDAQDMLSDMNARIKDLNNTLSSVMLEKKIKEEMITAQAAYMNVLLLKTLDCNLHCQTKRNDFTEIIKAQNDLTTISHQNHDVILKVLNDQRELESDVYRRLVEIQDLKRDTLDRAADLVEKDRLIADLNSKLECAQKKYDHITEAIFLYNKSNSKIPFDSYLANIEKRYEEVVSEKNRQLENMKKQLEVFSLREAVKSSVHEILKTNMSKVLNDNIGLNKYVDRTSHTQGKQDFQSFVDRRGVDNLLEDWFKEISKLLDGYRPENREIKHLIQLNATLVEEQAIMHKRNEELSHIIKDMGHEDQQKRMTLENQALNIDELNRLINTQQTKIIELEAALMKEKLRFGTSHQSHPMIETKSVSIDVSKEVEELKSFIMVLREGIYIYNKDFSQKAKIEALSASNINQKIQSRVDSSLVDDLSKLLLEIDAITRNLVVQNNNYEEFGLGKIDETNAEFIRRIKVPELRVKILENALEDLKQKSTIKVPKNFVVENLQMPNLKNALEGEVMEEVFKASEDEMLKFIDENNFMKNDKITSLLRIGIVYLRLMRTHMDECVE